MTICKNPILYSLENQADIGLITVFNLGRVFASLKENILFWRKMKWSCSHTDAKKKRAKINWSCLIHKYSQGVAGNNEGKLKKLFFSLKRASKLLVFQTMCVQYFLCQAFLYSELVSHFLQSRFSWTIIWPFTAINNSKLWRA